VSRVSRQATGLIAGIAALGLTFLLPAQPAAGDDRPTFSSTLPPNVTAIERTRIAFDVTASGGICATDLTDWGARLEGAGPYVLVLDPDRIGMGRRDVTVVVTDCAGNVGYVTTAVSVPFTATWSHVVAPWATDAPPAAITIAVENGLQQNGRSAGSPVRVSVLHNGKVVKTFPPVTTSARLRFPMRRTDARGTWAVHASNGTASLTGRVTVARKWALENDLGMSFEPCSTVTWRYSPKGAPARSTGIEGDVATALGMIARATGITFRRVTSHPQLALGWKNLGAHGPSGVGGYTYSSYGESTTYLGYVDLNSKDEWVGKPGFGRVVAWGGTPARGALLLHELAHAMGLAHVDAPDQVMNPVTGPSSPTRFSAGDLAGFVHIYEPATCPAA
jgi:hypothetical protein